MSFKVELSQFSVFYFKAFLWFLGLPQIDCKIDYILAAANNFLKFGINRNFT